MKTRILKIVTLAWMPVAALTLAGCWTPPNANVQPIGKPGLIQNGIAVESVKDPATVQAIDAAAGTITLQLSDKSTLTCKVGAQVEIPGHIQVGDQVKATVTEDLTVYILENGRLPDGTTAESLGINAKVLQVDPSYRILTLQYPNGQSEKVKPGLGTKMEEMAPGDSVVVRPIEVTAIKVEKP
ncbi:MAG: hypothetical protein WAO02_04250 [Verrucomicrobiia bacterium]